ncbi:MAG: ribokinase [Trueperaceae bacterium]|nr:ribokinase [Trueperaceae bacterium]
MDLVVSVPRFPVAGETLLGGDYARHPGGKGANQAVAAARAGGAVAMVGRVGADAFGDALTRGLAADGVATEAIAALADAPTGVAFISIDPSAQNTIIVAPGANARLAPRDLDAARFAGARVVLLQLEVPLETTLRAAELGRGAGARVVLNLAPAQPLTAAQLADVDLLLVNETEAAGLTGIPVDEVARAPERAAAALTALVPAAVLTLGAAGAAWAEAGADAAAGDAAGTGTGAGVTATHAADAPATGLVPGFVVEAVDTTAAGDAFAGALAVRLAQGAPLAEAVRHANAAGALAATRPGAQPSLPTAAEIDAFLARQRLPAEEPSG